MNIAAIVAVMTLALGSDKVGPGGLPCTMQAAVNSVRTTYLEVGNKKFADYNRMLLDDFVKQVEVIDVPDEDQEAWLVKLNLLADTLQTGRSTRIRLIRNNYFLFRAAASTVTDIKSGRVEIFFDLAFLELAQPSDANLRALLAHELGHDDRDPYTKFILRSNCTSEQVSPLEYLLELQADNRAMQLLAQRGENPLDLMAALDILRVKWEMSQAPLDPVRVELIEKFAAKDRFLHTTAH